MFTGRTTLIVQLIFIIFSAFVEITNAKSVYVINDTDYGFMRAYKIEGESLVYQTDYHIGYEEYPIGIAIDESVYGGFLFVTFDVSGTIEIIDANSWKNAPDPFFPDLPVFRKGREIN